MMPSTAGVLLVEPSLKLIYANSEAIGVLVFPEDPKNIKSLDVFLAERIRSILVKRGSSPPPAFITDFISGRRRYLCRAFSLNAQQNHEQAMLALLLERDDLAHFDASKVAVRFHMTPREQETLLSLLRGLTNKEIANRMDISPNTVKAFLKLIMIKMGVSTRSAILAKAFGFQV